MLLSSLAAALLATLALAHGGRHAHAHPHAHSHALDKAALPGASAPPALYASLFPLSAISLPADSRMAVQQARNSRYLTSLNSSRLACLYTSAANLTGTWEKPSCIPYDHPQYWGHYLGHWLSAAALSDAALCFCYPLLLLGSVPFAVCVLVVTFSWGE